MDIHSYTTDEILARPLTKQEDFHESLEKKDIFLQVPAVTVTRENKLGQLWLC